jgi:hypothetical protein
MKSFKDYLSESEYGLHNPLVGDNIDIELTNDSMIESYVVELVEDGVIIQADERVMQLLEQHGYTTEEIRRYGAVGSNAGQGYTVDEAQDTSPVDRIMELAGIAQPMDEDEGAGQLVAKTLALEPTGPTSGEIDEAEYQGREVSLNKPMAGDVKKSKVYVKNASGNVVKVNFGDPNMRIKKSSPARRKSFRARHNCENPGPKTSARYWSCRAW